MKTRPFVVAGILGLFVFVGVLWIAPLRAEASGLPASTMAVGRVAAESTIHVVQPGETLASIAARYGTTVATLQQLNSLRNPNRILVGQRLVVSRGSSSTPAAGMYTVRRGDTLSSIGRRFGVSPDDLMRANNLRSTLIYVGQQLSIPNGTTDTPSNGGGATASGPKKIVVSISQQRCWRYQGETLLNTWRCSTGRNNSTKAGVFKIQSKLRKAYGSTWGIWMPYWLGIYWSGPVENGIHGLPWNAKTGARTWAGLVGTPITYGCVMLNDAAMKAVWDWADIGTTVVIKR